MDSITTDTTKTIEASLWNNDGSRRRSRMRRRNRRNTHEAHKSNNINSGNININKDNSSDRQPGEARPLPRDKSELNLTASKTHIYNANSTEIGYNRPHHQHYCRARGNCVCPPDVRIERSLAACNEISCEMRLRLGVGENSPLQLYPPPIRQPPLVPLSKACNKEQAPKLKGNNNDNDNNNNSRYLQSNSNSKQKFDNWREDERVEERGTFEILAGQLRPPNNNERIIREYFNEKFLLLAIHSRSCSSSSSSSSSSSGSGSGNNRTIIETNNRIDPGGLDRDEARRRRPIHGDEIIHPMRKDQQLKQLKQQKQQLQVQVQVVSSRGSFRSNGSSGCRGNSFSSVSSGSGVSFIVKLFLICHLIQSLLVDITNRRESQETGLKSHHDGLPPPPHLSLKGDWNGQSSGEDWQQPVSVVGILGGAALFVVGAAAEPQDYTKWEQQQQPPPDELMNRVDLLLVSSNATTPPASEQQFNGAQKSPAYRLLNENMLIYQANKDPVSQQEEQAKPLDSMKHNMHNKHRHYHQHKHKHKRNHHHHLDHHHQTQNPFRQTNGRSQIVEDSINVPSRVEGRAAAAAAAAAATTTTTTTTTNQRVRRNHDGFYDGTAADRPVVASRRGLVRGVTQKLFTGKFVDAFLGMPYAKPPIGNYRFRHPQPTDPWEGELDASRMPNSCYQVNDTYFGANFQGTKIWNANTPLSEDCLYLNIWTPFGVANTTVPSTPNKVYRPPSSEQNNKTSKRPILVWIFGGGFYYGTSTLTLYEGGLLASEEDIIVVSINYRVSALGFLYLGRPDAPGNAGLFDQLLALQWIQDNIEQFGGDPDRVTIFGESAGAVSAAFHLLSPLSRNLFSQAILQSGAATCPWGCMEPREIMTNGLKLASLLNCPSNASDLDSVVECLTRIDPMSMVLQAQDVDPNRSLLNFPFVPVVDGSFLLETPNESLIKSNFKRARILLGSNYDEGGAFLIYLTEFNHCPGGNTDHENENAAGDDINNNNNNNNKLLSSSSQIISNKLPGPTNNYPSAAAAIETTSEPSSASGATGELRDQSIESMELGAAAAAAASQQHQQMVAALLASPNEPEVGMGTGRSTQHNLPPNHSDSNPCKPNESPSLTREGFLRTLKNYLNPYAEHPIGKEAIVFEYSNWNNPQDSISNYDALDKIVGDYHFTCHVNEFAYRYASTGNSVFMYYFKQRSSVSQWPKWMGVLHGDEIAFVFGEPLNQSMNYTAREVELSRRMMKYWANFAKFGNPTKLSENVSMVEKWPEYGNNRQYFELHGDFIRVGRGPRAKQCAFWANYLPKLIDSFDHSQCPAPSSSHAATLDDQYRCPPTRYHPMDPSFSQHQRNGLLNNLPSLVIVSLSVILVLSIIGLLIYAKRTGKLELNLSSGSD